MTTNLVNYEATRFTALQSPAIVRPRPPHLSRRSHVKLLPLLAASLILAGCSSGGSSSSGSGSSNPPPDAPPNAGAAQVGGAAGPVRVGGKDWTRTNLRIVKGTQIDYESWLSGELLPMGTPLTVTETAK